MIKVCKNSNKAIIIVHEIYGVNQHIKDVCNVLAEQHFDVICPNLLNQEPPFGYHQEEEAYRNFIDHIGFTKAFQKVQRVIQDMKNQYEKIFVVGFSAGATIAWMCGVEENVAGIVGYYGSRIRDFAKISPQCPVLLFFPEEEKSFNVAALTQVLDKPNVKIHICGGEHGFSDPYSAKFNATSAGFAYKKTLELLNKN
jgi:dienelactone hydrolase